ncbi:hypothetical protein [Streptomyces sp. AP-93]|uniref:hypothetical protein n=1 Tax=Streptomyces sp. AP-93 TaxID=2929048 RepID=UPI001FAE9583|nr:hypothetical protein [Streptomyces sp. AP-93]MCJ0871376.1 hypothetical protein [Streptomyces sp. AP-93]
MTGRLRAPHAPVTVAALAMAAVHCVGVLPPVVRWADAQGWVPETRGIWVSARLLLVSPSLRMDGRAAWEAAGTEALWTLAFIGVLSALVTLLLRAVAAEDPDRPSDDAAALVPALQLVYPLLAPVVNLVALAISRAGRLASEPALRGDEALLLLDDAHRWAGHALLLGLVGGFAAGCAVVLAHVDTKPAAPTPRRAGGRARRALAVLDGLPARIGGSLLATAVSVIVLLALAVDLPGTVLTPFAELWCDPGTAKEEAMCVRLLSGSVSHTMPFRDLAVGSSLFGWLLAAYGTSTFGASAFAVHFYVRGLVGALPPVMRTALSVAAGYTVGSIVCVAVVTGLTDVAAGGSTPLGATWALREMVVLRGLPHAMYGAPVAALLAASAVALRGRLAHRAGATETDAGTRAEPAGAARPAPEPSP